MLIRSSVTPASGHHSFVKKFAIRRRVRGVATLGYRGYLTIWRILHLEVLVGETSGPVKLKEMRHFVLGDDLERMMAASDTPFTTLYTILNEFCVPLVMDTVIIQIQELRIGRWKDAIQFELISDGYQGQGSSASYVQMSQDGEADFVSLRTLGDKILYWLESEKNSQTSDAISCHCIKIEPMSDLRIKYLHSSFVIDSLTNQEAELSINIELGENSHIRRAGGDVLHTGLNEPGSEDNNVIVPDFQPKQGVKIDTDQNVTKSSASIDYSAVIGELIKKLESRRKILSSGYVIKAIQLEKNDDTNYHMDFIAGLANMRAKNYRIPDVDKLRAKFISQQSTFDLSQLLRSTTLRIEPDVYPAMLT
nr:mediator of RNA polymerase II transcription subunit 14 [Tanacetum cinerariifolium]